jgi:hypothetical protein
MMRSSKYSRLVLADPDYNRKNHDVVYGGVISLHVNVAVTLQIDDRKVIVEDTSTNSLIKLL